MTVGYAEKVSKIPGPARDFVWLLLVLLGSGAGCGDGEKPDELAAAPGARFVERIEWLERGVWLKADLHIHTQFSDGAHSLDKVVDQAARFGCDVIAITDHADRELQGATPEYFDAIRAARQRHPERIILAGLEWNVPPWDGREHAVVLVPPGPDESQILAQFKARFDDLQRDTHESALADEALRWLGQQRSAEGLLPLVIYEHPNRKRFDTSEFTGEYFRLRGVSDRLIGFTGAPGHQRAASTGAYEGLIKTVDRWDPSVAEPDGTWNQVLRQGGSAWAALAPSDFHDVDGDYWPGEFSATWLYVPEKSPAGIWQALQAGSFFGVHGELVQKVQLKVRAAGLDRPAYSGETIEVPEGSRITVELEYVLPDRDWEGQTNDLDELQLIRLTPGNGYAVTHRTPNGGSPVLLQELIVGREPLTLRARGLRFREHGPNLAFYTNPIRIVPQEPSAQVVLNRLAPVTSRLPPVFGGMQWSSLRRPGARTACSLALLLAAIPLVVACSRMAQGASSLESLATLSTNRLHPVDYAAWAGYLGLLMLVAWHVWGQATHTDVNWDSVHFGVYLLLLGLLAMAAAPLLPVTGFLVYCTAYYLMPRDHGATEFIMQLDGTTWLVALNVAAMAVRCVRHRQLPTIKWNAPVLAIFALMVWLSLVVLASVYEGRPLVPDLTHRAIRFLEAFGLFLVAVSIGWNLADWRLFALGFSIVLALRQIVFSSNILLEQNLAILVAIMFPIVIAAAATAPGWMSRIGFLLVAAFLLRMIMIIQNRGAAVGLALALLVLWACSRYRWRVALVAVPVIVVALIVSTESGLATRFREIYHDGRFQGSAASRLELWKAGWRMGQEHLVWGVGPDNFPLYVPQYNPLAEEHSAHNIFLDMFAETGVVGVALFTILILAATWTLIRIAARCKRDWRGTMAGAVLASLWAYVGAGCFLSVHSLVVTYFLIGAAIVLASRSETDVELLPTEWKSSRFGQRLEAVTGWFPPVLSGPPRSPPANSVQSR